MLDRNSRPSETFCRCAIHSFESDLKSPVDATDRSDHMGITLDEDGGSGFEMDNVFRLDVEPEETVQTMGAAQPADPDLAAFSRRTRRQR